ncbi:DUF3592 domain-containing protein [Aquipseudomonas alcaligenes]|uniref:DUF3592 domain-containing protein n=1 Tax=Aquipseudomonas alcaligenes TaxID=43263 RepID=A0A1N6QNF7_AQUAC|nr:DUF3592 domain-containing protein [Pseudomonas alcaligenes]SIQ18143.1 Protein of unknown function [Pseudomonas alcaligenes]
MKQVLYLLMLGVMLYFGIQQALEMGDSREWPTTEGVITASRIDRQLADSAYRSGYEYEVRVEYSYQVDGVRYQGNRLRIQPAEYSSASSARRELMQYPVGGKVRVYYNPQQPERSLLKHI